MTRHIKNKFVIPEYLSRIFWANLNNGLGALSYLLISVIFINNQKETLYGQFIILVSVFNLLSLLSITGIRATVLRALAQGYDKTYVTTTKFSLKFSFIGIVALCATGSYYFIYQDKNIGIILFLSILCFPFFSVLNIWEYALKGKARFKMSACFTFIKVGAQLIYTFVVACRTDSLLLFFSGYMMLDSVFNIVFFLYVKAKIIGNDNLDQGWKAQSYTMTFLDMSSAIFGKADILIMGSFINPAAVAVYTVVMKINDFFYMIIKNTFLVFLPEFYKNEVKISVLIKSVLLVGLISVIASIFIALPVRIVYGEHVEKIAEYSRIYLLALPLYFMATVSNHYLIKTRQNASIFRNKLIAISVTVLLYFVLIPTLGIAGGIISSFVYFAMQSICNILSINHLNLPKGDLTGKDDIPAIKSPSSIKIS
jgi:O-antigen/teichoic acid export membrane protein